MVDLCELVNGLVCLLMCSGLLFICIVSSGCM